MRECLYEFTNSRGALSYATTYTCTKHLALEIVKGNVQSQNTRTLKEKEELATIVGGALRKNASKGVIGKQESESEGLLNVERGEGRGNWF
jgi:hypothetical protein